MYVIDDIINAIGASDAASKQEQAAREAMDLQRQMYGQTRADQQGAYQQQRTDQAPWLQAGQSSLADLMRQMQSGGFDTRFDPSQLANDPGYQFRMQQGQQALERSAAARGGLNSGGFMKSLSRYGQGFASNEYQNAWQRNQTENSNRFSRLAQLAGVGQGTAQNLGALGSQNAAQLGASAANYGNSMSDLYGAVGNAQAAGEIAQHGGAANAWRSLANIGMMGATGSPGGGFAGMNIPRQGASTGYAGGYMPQGGFGLNYGGY